MFGFLGRKKPVKTAVGVGVKQSEPMSSGDLKKSISDLEKQLQHLKSMASGNDEIDVDVVKSDSEKVIEGVFDGQNMIGSDGQQYDVPANYASKSKLVEGDILKLTINNLGSFVYKQIKPIERRRMVGDLTQDPQSLQFHAELDGKKWRLLTASVTYFKGEAEDEVMFLIPKEGGSRWAAVENIIKRK